MCTFIGTGMMETIYFYSIIFTKLLTNSILTFKINLFIIVTIIKTLYVHQLIYYISFFVNTIVMLTSFAAVK